MTTNTNAALREFAEGRIHHLNRGQCPDIVAGHDSRDPDCPVCAALTTAAAVPAASRHSEYPPLPEPDTTTVGLGAVWNRHSMRAYVDAARALLAQAAPAAVAGPSLYQVMAVAKAIHATTPDADDWDSLRQWEVDALRRRAEKVLAAPAAAPTTQAAPAISAGDAVFAFASMLTALPHAIPFGAAAWATPGVELATAFNAANGFSVSQNFPDGLVFPKITGDLLAVVEKAAAPVAQGDAEYAAPSQKEGL